jgi:D-glutamate N-acetyltransferase
VNLSASPLRKPYLLFLGDVQDKLTAKTAFGLKDWCAADVAGEWSLPGCSVTLGLARLSPREAAARGAGSIVVGIAPTGGILPAHWIAELVAAAAAGLDVVSGLHSRLTSFPDLVQAASRRGVRLIDVRHSDQTFGAASGRKRSGKRVLTVGTDCALGKKYTALALARNLKSRGVAASFRATGQTGIMISGEGIAIDAIVADFIAGAAEQLSPDNAADHWDVIEGQGSLFHPAYAGVTLGLLHGSQPDAIVLCHDPSRRTIDEYPDFPIPDLQVVIDDYVRAGRLTNPGIRCVGLSINSSSLSDAGRADYVGRLTGELGLPVCDPVRTGVDVLADALLAY